MINYPRSLQSDLSFSWRRSGLQVRMCFSSFVNRQPLRGLQTALLTVPEHRGCSGWQKRKGDVSHERREKKGGEGKLAKNNPNSSTLKFWMRFCQGSGNWKGKCICFPTDCLFSAWWWQKYTKQYGPVWNYLKATRISLVQSAELKWSWLVIGSGDQLRLLCSVRAVCSCQFPLNKTQITVWNLKNKPCYRVSWIIFCYKTSSGNFLKIQIGSEDILIFQVDSEIAVITVLLSFKCRWFNGGSLIAQWN